MMTDRDFEIEAEKALMLLKENLNGLLDLAHLGGMRDEQLRIIKLLEPLAVHDELCKHGCYPEDCSAASYEYAIELIKGEQK